MDSREVGVLLEDCVRAAQVSTQPSEEDRLNYCSCTDALCAELASLLQEAMDMKWPFAPEKWQYKQSLSPSDKTNLSDLISKHLHQLLTVLKVSIKAQEARMALAVVFLVDRFLYWNDESGRLLKITRLLHRHHPRTPVAPQLVIRQARVYLNSGKLQSAEYILSSLINYSGATGCWVYQSESDRALVQAVSVQVRGMILQKLGLWLQAAELIWASLVGFYALPQPDKKGISTSLGLLANILVSMNNDDFHIFSTNPDNDLSLLGDRSHRLLSAAQAAKMAVIYSQYTSLYVLTNVATQGTCLLSYSFSVQCPVAQRHSFLLQAREAFAIGLLTKAEGEPVTSKQELHTFLKAAYSLTVTHKWLGTPRDVVVQATQACQKALAAFYDYSNADPQDKDNLCAEIMHLVAQVKLLLRVEPFPNSDKGSFIPDSYRVIEDTLISFTLEGFAKVMKRFQKFHASMCETGDAICKKDEPNGGKLCITSIGTTVALNTNCNTEDCKGSKEGPEVEEPQQRGSHSPAVCPPQDPNTCPTTLGSKESLGSSWHNFSSGGSGSPRPSSSGYTGSIAIEPNSNNQSLPTTEDDEDVSDENKKRDLRGYNSNISSCPFNRSVAHGTSSSNASSGSEKFEFLQEGIETLGTEDDAVGVLLKQSGPEGAAQSLSQLSLRTTSSSLGDSFSSGSSWEKISADTNSPVITKPHPSGLVKAGTSQSSKSPESDESFFLMETLDPETPDSAHDHVLNDPTSGSKPQPLEGLVVDQNVETECNSASVEPASKNTPQQNLSPSVSGECAPTDISTESSFEMLEDDSSSEKKIKKNTLCSTCSKHSSVGAAVPERQYMLSEQDYQTLLAGVCNECLLKRLQNEKTKFRFENYKSAHSALHLKFSKATGLWTARETCVYIGEEMGVKGNQRKAIWVQFLHQEERLSSYVGKEYLERKNIQFHLKDVERQMTAQYYVTEFNKSLYDEEVMAQIFFIPSEALLILNGDEIVGCVTVEPYMLGKFVKLTNNTRQANMTQEATKYGLAFGHFTYLFSGCQEVVVDLQGWVTANGKGLTYLTDPQIHSTRMPRGSSNFADGGLRCFLKEQHGPECNEICQLLKLPPVVV